MLVGSRRADPGTAERQRLRTRQRPTAQVRPSALLGPQRSTRSPRCQSQELLSAQIHPRLSIAAIATRIPLHTALTTHRTVQRLRHAQTCSAGPPSPWPAIEPCEAVCRRDGRNRWTSQSRLHVLHNVARAGRQRPAGEQRPVIADSAKCDCSGMGPSALRGPQRSNRGLPQPACSTTLSPGAERASDWGTRKRALPGRTGHRGAGCGAPTTSRSGPPPLRLRLPQSLLRLGSLSRSRVPANEPGLGSGTPGLGGRAGRGTAQPTVAGLW